MALRKGREPSAGLEALAWISQFDPPSAASLALQDIQRQQAIVETLKRGMDESLSNAARLHGWRVQNLFEAVVVSLGSVRLITTEDAGAYYFDDVDGLMKPPDFRIVRQDGQQVLVEVKNVPPSLLESSLRDQDVQAGRRYAELTAARLLYAHYWSAANIWTLVDPDVMGRKANRWVLSLPTAAKANEFSTLGDVVIGTRPPLMLSLLADPTRPQTFQEVSESELRLGFTVGGTELSCAGRILTDPIECKIAWFLMRYGKWGMEESAELDDEQRIRSLNFTCSPEVPDEEAAQQLARQGFAIVDYLSSMYSTMYNAITVSDMGEVQRLRHETDPGALAMLIPNNYGAHPHRDLPIWQLIVQASS